MVIPIEGRSGEIDNEPTRGPGMASLHKNNSEKSTGNATEPAGQVMQSVHAASLTPSSDKGSDGQIPTSGVGITPVQQMISSCSGAVLTALTMTPLDVVKIRLQSQRQTFKDGTCFIYSNGLMDCLCVCSHCENGKNNVKDCKIRIKPWYNKPGHFKGTMSLQNGQLCHLHDVCYENHSKITTVRQSAGSLGAVSGSQAANFRGTLDAFIKIARYEGLSSLWSGLPPTLLMSIPATIFYFTTYDQLKFYMGYRENDPRTRYVPMLAGSTARVGTVILISPMELVRTKMQSEQLSYREVSRAVKTSIKQDGLLAIMRGVGPTLLRDVPFSALYWFGYEYVKALQLRLQGNTQVTFSQSFIAGSTSGCIAGLLTLPFDVVKTHRQIQMGQANLLKGTKVVSTYSVMSQIYRQNGFQALFTGAVPRLAKVAPACAIMVSTYEYCKSYFRARNHATQSPAAVKGWS